ncbi:MAG: hypothetical protein HZB55_17660 [Deltaproteobacteria bacterium]|nr:hypothetical protein [Deltaproteobacteria bacterium]
MDKTSQKTELLKYLNTLLSRKWFILVPAAVAGLTATLYSVTLPNKFRSRTLIFVTPQKVPEKYVSSTVTTDLRERLNTISQQILSRTALEQIISEFSLFLGEKNQNYSSEEIVNLMRKRVSIDLNRSGRVGESFEVSYVDADPRTAMVVTNRLAGLFIEENLKDREQQAIGTSQFLADEIDRYKGAVQQKEQEIYEFKKKFMNELNDQLASNQARLNELQNRLQMNTQSINAAKDRKVLLQQQMADMEKRVQDERERLTAQAKAQFARDRELAAVRREGSVRRPPDAPPPTALERELDRQEEELASLRATHTDRHPDVVRLAANVKRLRSQMSKERAQPGPGLIPADSPASEASQRTSANVETDVHVEYPPAYYQLKTDIARSEADAVRLVVENQSLQRAVETYQARIGAAPARELQMKQLSEGYTNMKAVLEDLTNKKLEADLSENMERKQKGEQFRIVDPANLPEKPFWPNRIGISLGGMGGGAMLGAGVVFVLDFLIPAVRSRDELESLVGLPVLGVIPEIVTDEDRVRARKLRVWGAGVAAGTVLVAALAVHLAVKPLPQAFGDFYTKVQNTYWTTTR